MKKCFRHICVSKLSNSSSSEESKIKHIKDYPYYPIRSALNNKIEVIFKKLPTVFSAESFIRIVEETIPSIYGTSCNRKQLDKWISVWYLRIRADLFVPLDPIIVKEFPKGKRLIFGTKGIWRKRG